MNAVCDIEEAPFRDAKEFLGVDCGIVQLATDSDGKSFSGRQVEKRRNRFANLRTKLQAKGTPSAKRHLQRLRGKQQNYQKSENHRISKRIVEKAKGTDRSIALEDLSGIGSGVTVRKSQKAKIANWSFYGLQQYVSYKAKREGINVVFVDPRNTSRQCSKCSHCEKSNRKSQSEFLCKSCGFSANADRNAAVNIKLRAMSASPTIPKRISVAASCQLQTPSITVSV